MELRWSILTAAVLGLACAGPRPLPLESRPLTAVLPFVYTAGTAGYEDSAKGIADALSGALLRTRQFRVVERLHVDKVLSEAALSQTGTVDPAKTVEAGRLLGAQRLVLGSVVSLSVREEGRSVHFAEKTTRWVELEAEAKLVDARTGELLASARAVGKADSAEKHAFGGQIGQLATPQALVQQALSGLGDKLAQDLASGVSSR